MVAAEPATGPRVAGVADILERLVEMGLDEAEARAYLDVSSMGPSKAGDIAKRLNVPRGEAYRVLQKLVEREFVTASASRPALFRAAPVAELFEGLLETERRRLARIEGAQREVAEALERLQAAGLSEPALSSFHVLHGRKSALTVLDRMIDEAHRDVTLVFTHPAAAAAARHLTGGPRAGRHVRILVDEGLPADFSALGAEVVRVAPSVPMGCAIVDGREVLLWIVTDPSQRSSADGDVTLWSDAPDLVGMQGALVHALWTTLAAKHQPK